MPGQVVVGIKTADVDLPDAKAVRTVAVPSCKAQYDDGTNAGRVVIRKQRQNGPGLIQPVAR